MTMPRRYAPPLDRRPRRASAFLALTIGCSALRFLACSSTEPDPRCIGPLSEVGQWCPKTYDGAVATMDRCSGLYVARAGKCGAQLAYVNESGTHGWMCFYDATTKALTGAVVSTDTPTYCGDAFDRIAGTGDVSCRRLKTYDRVRDCWDEWTPDAAAGTAASTFLDAEGDGGRDP